MVAMRPMGASLLTMLETLWKGNHIAKLARCLENQGKFPG